MKQVLEYRQHAEECRALAAKVRYADHKNQLLDLAAKWDTLAREREKMLETKRRLANTDIAHDGGVPLAAARDTSKALKA